LVVVKLRRKTKNETVRGLPVDLPEQKKKLRRKVATWAEER
jgi:hypothetical protein